MTKALVDQRFKNTVVAHGASLGIAVDIVERNPADKGFVPDPRLRDRPASSESRVVGR
ncbi:hypothetical protein ACWCOT_44305 [Nonomuraea bangladeshensis]